MELKLSEKERKIAGKILEAIEKNDSFLITTHKTIDGDALSCELVLYMLLKKMGKKSVEIINQDMIPRMYEFLPHVQDAKTVFNYSGNRRYDVVFIVDCGVLERIGKVQDILPKNSLIINIDHHNSNPMFGNINWVDASYGACGEMLFFLLQEFSTIDPMQATCLYTAILTDTGSFMYHFGSKTFAIADLLVNKGADPKEIAHEIFMKRSLNSLKLLALCLQTLQFDNESKACWMKITQEMLKSAGTGEEDTEGFVNYLSSVSEADFAFLLKERTNGTKVSFRSRNRIDVDKLAQHFGGGGHVEAAGCFIENTTPEEAVKQILLIAKQEKDM